MTTEDAPAARTEAPSEPSAAAEAVCVAVNVRPLVAAELAEGCSSCLRITPGEPQVGHGTHLFTYDHVFGVGAEPPGALYERCVAPLVDGLFRGYNATVFAYGQTGSGKTYTMGSAFTPGGDPRGVIPSVMDAIFARIAAGPRDLEFNVRVGFVEIHKEEIHDLLCTGRGPHPVVHIREVTGGGVCLAGATEREVHSREEMVEVLEHGALLRATAATGMNKQSSRSHAIFTITLEQRRLVEQPSRARSSSGGQEGSGDDDDEEEEDEDEDEAGAGGDDVYLCAKMHLVDLAGSERAKRTKAVGTRLQEGININKGLLALGNVINALSEGKAHVPYRDSKLTRMLQDSLGGNSRTVMIACVSPADVNLEESLNTLRYANRARNIHNKPVVNRDPVAAQLAQLRQLCAALRAENASLKSRLGEGSASGLLEYCNPVDDVLRGAVEDMEAQNRTLQAENQRLRVERDAAQDDLKDATEKMIVAQAQRDRLRQRLHALDPSAAAEATAEVDALADGTSSEGDVVRCQLERIAELEREVKRLKQLSRLSGAFAISRRQSLGGAGLGVGSDDMPVLHASPFHLTPLLHSPGDDGEEHGSEGATAKEQICALEMQDEEFVAQEQAHSMEVARLRDQLSRLHREMEAKQAAMQSMSQHSMLRQRYDEKLLALSQEKVELEQERVDLLQKLERLQHASEDERHRLREQYEARIKALDSRVKAVAAKEKKLQELERMKRKADEACLRLEHDIRQIKQQKVSLQRQMDKSAREFAEWKRERDRELLQLKKQGRSNAAQMQKLEALHFKQQAVLRRKTEEAEAARRRLKDMEDRKHRLAASRPTTAASAADRPFTAVSAADRPFTAPAVPPASGSSRPPTSGGSGSGSSNVTSVERSSSSVAAADSECQPNPLAPLLRDEKTRREWVETELDAHCSSFELQKVMEGERALRSEVQRKVMEVEKSLAALKAPEWWPGHATSPSSANEDKLLARKAELLRQRDLHTKRFEQAQAKLMEARAAEDAKGGVPADVRRWNGVRTVVQARALLKTIFRAASQHKADAMEAQAQLADMNDELELLKLRLDIAEQEKYEAAQQVAKAEVMLKLAEERGSGDVGGSNGVTPMKQLLTAQPGVSDPPADEGLREAHEILQQLNVLAKEGQLTQSEVPAATGGQQNAVEEDEVPSEENEESWDEDEEDEEDEDDDEEEEEQSEDEDRHALWDPSQATPAHGLKKARRAAAAAAAAAAPGSEAAQQQGQRRQSGQSRRRRSSTSSAPLLPEEQPVLNHLNEQLRKAGKEPVSRPTVPLMKAVLKDKILEGKRWRAGSKKREELIRDYRLMLGLKPEVHSPPTGPALTAAPGSSGSGWAVPPAPPQQQQQVVPPPSRSGGEGTSRSRILKHTASSLARCAATQHHQHHPHAAPAPAAGASAAPRAFGSPLPPAAPRSRAGSASAEQLDGNTTPVGAEGQQTPEAAELQGTATGRQASHSGAADDGSSKQRDLQLQELRQQLSVLTMEGVTLGMNPNAAPAAAPAAPLAAPAAAPAAEASTGSPGRRGRSRSDIVPASSTSASSSQRSSGSPLRRALSLAGWRGTPKEGVPRPETAPSGQQPLRRLDMSRSLSPDGTSQPCSPALLLYQQRVQQAVQEEAEVSQQIDAAVRSSGGGSSPGRLARLFGRHSFSSPTKAAKQAAVGSGIVAAAGAGPDSAYELQLPPQQQQQAPVQGKAAVVAAAANPPLRSSNSTSDGAGAGASRSASPTGSRDFRISSFSPENLSEASSPQPVAGLSAAGSGGAGGGSSGAATARPRSSSSASTVLAAPPRPQTSPRKAVWKPL